MLDFKEILDQSETTDEIKLESKIKAITNEEKILDTHLDLIPCTYTADIYPLHLEDRSTQRASILFRKVAPFFFTATGPAYLREMKQIIENQLPISLRLLEWFVITYSKTHTTHYKLQIFDKKKEHMVDRIFIVYQSYQECLGKYHKRYFDPTRRKGNGLGGQKFVFGYENDPSTQLETCLKQLVFFKWAFENGVVNYVKRNQSVLATVQKETTRINQMKHIEKKARHNTRKRIRNNKMNKCVPFQKDVLELKVTTTK
jgi:hypothetical protein